MKYRLPIILFLVAGLTAPTQAGIIFGRKKEKIDPQKRVPELVTILRTDRDADKRTRAAEELRNYDPNAHPEIVPALVDAMRSDQKPGVRTEAAQTLGRIRPVSQAAGEALEHSLATDPSMRVRLQARSSLMQYHWAGYHSNGKKADTPPPLATGQPPMSGTNSPPAIRTTPMTSTPPNPIVTHGLRPVPVNKGNRPTLSRSALTPAGPSTQEPPLAPPEATPAAMPPISTTPPADMPAVPSGPMALPAPLPSAPSSGGPELP